MPASLTVWGPEGTHVHGTAASGAELDAAGVYRYRLWRRWSDGPRGLFIMLNPSTADHAQDDPTIRRVVAFARREGWGGVDVVNLFALRATKPGALLTYNASGARGPGNAATLANALQEADHLVAAWGSWVDQGPVRRQLGNPDRELVNLAERYRRQLYCLGRTAQRCPRHPLYVRADQALQPWPR